MLNVDYEDFDAPTIRCPEERLWIEVLTYVIADAKRGNKPALAYVHDSPQFEFLCSALGYNAVAICERIVPTDFVQWLQTVRKPVVRRTDKVDDTPVRESYYMRRKHRAAQMPRAGAARLVAAPAVVPAQVSVASRIKAALAPGVDQWEDALASVIQSASFEEYEAALERMEIEACIREMEYQPCL